MVEHIEVGLLGELQQVLNDLADLRCDFLADNLVRLDELGDTEGGLHADGELGVVESSEDSMEVLPKVLLVRPLQTRLGEGAEDLESLNDKSASGVGLERVGKTYHTAHVRLRRRVLLQHVLLHEVLHRRRVLDLGVAEDVGAERGGHVERTEALGGASVAECSVSKRTNQRNKAATHEFKTLLMKVMMGIKVILVRVVTSVKRKVVAAAVGVFSVSYSSMVTRTYSGWSPDHMACSSAFEGEVGEDEGPDEGLNVGQ